MSQMCRKRCWIYSVNGGIRNRVRGGKSLRLPTAPVRTGPYTAPHVIIIHLVSSNQCSSLTSDLIFKPNLLINHFLGKPFPLLGYGINLLVASCKFYPLVRLRTFTGSQFYDYYGFICKPLEHNSIIANVLRRSHVVVTQSSFQRSVPG